MDEVTTAPPGPGSDGGYTAEDVDDWTARRLARDYERVPPRAKEFITLSGRPVKDVYTSADLAGFDERRDLGLPGEFPFTRGVHASMHRGKPWTIRQVAGFGQAEDTNGRYKYLLEHGEDGLSTDFDLPTLLGYDSDHPVYGREVGKIGVAIDTVVDMHALFDGIPLDEVSTSLTINAPASILIAMYRVVGEERGIAGGLLTGTAQNDILKEYTAQNEFIFPPDPSVELVVDTMDYCAQQMPRFNPVSMSGYHPRDAGATAPQEVALTIAGALCYLERAMERGIDPDVLAPRVSFFWNVHNDFFEEIAKLRAARRLWARLMKDRLRCTDQRSWLMRAHCQTSGVSLTAQQPLNNIARVAVQALAGVLGGTQSLHTNSFDEAFAIPSEAAIKVAVRTQQILLHETGAADVVDPLAGSYYVESLTTQIEEEAADLIARIDAMGGMVAAITTGYANQLIADSAWEQQVKIEANDRTIVGVNDCVDDDRSIGGIELFTPDPGVHDRQVARLREVKASRDGRRVVEALRALEAVAPDLKHNRMPYIEEAVRARATVGEICDVLRTAFGEHPPSTIFSEEPPLNAVSATHAPIKVIVAKPGLDGHDRGAKVVARALRDAGMEVVYTGIFQTPESILRAVIQEDADVLGLSSLSGAHLEYAVEISELLAANGAEDVIFLVGGTIPDGDADRLREIGIAEVFGPGTPTADIIAFIRERVALKHSRTTA